MVRTFQGLRELVFLLYKYMLYIFVHKTLPFSSMAKSFFVLYICLQNVVPSSCGLSLSLRHEPPLLSQNTIYDKKQSFCRYEFQKTDYNSIIEMKILLWKLNRTSLFWTGPAAYSNKYIHLPEMVFALVCLGMSSVRLEHAGVRPGSAVFSIDLSSSFRGRFWRGLKKFSWANPEVLSSIVSRMISFTMKTLNHFYLSRL